MKYLKLFENHAEYEAYKNSQDYLTPNVSYCVDLNEVHFEKYVRDYSKEYLTFEALEDGNFTFTMDSKLGVNVVPYMSYSIDNGDTWVTVNNVDNETVTITTPEISEGGIVLWKSESVQFCTNTDPYPGGNIGYGRFSSTGEFNVSGNIMSLMYGDEFIGKTQLKELITTGYFTGSFYSILSSCSVVSASNLVLPVTTLVQFCYANMFGGCTSLITAPELPATTLANNCYSSMFSGCTSLTTAPELPATILANNCYSFMFQNCTSLTTAPELSVMTLADSCYSNMFSGCTSLTTAPELPATTLESSCYSNMFDGCTSLTTAPELPATTLESSCYYIMFRNCTSLTTAPELPATTLESSCYSNMFNGCANLNYIKAMFTTTPSSTYTSNWVSGVSSTGTFVKNSAATWGAFGSDAVPMGWTVQTASA